MHRAVATSAFVALLMAAVVLSPAIHGDVEGSVPEATAFTTQRKLVRFSDGSLALAYVVQVSGSNRVQVARSSDGVVWTPLDPPSLGGPTADRPALAVDSRDGLHLAWTANGTSSRQVFYASYASGRWSSAEQVSETQGYSGFPSIAVDSQDRLHVAWYGFDGTYYQVYYRMRAPTGWSPQVAVTAQNLDATNPAIALDGADVVHIVWYHANSRGTGFQVSYARLASSSISVDTISAADDAFDPTMVVDRGGRVLVAWTSFSTASQIATTVLSGGSWSPPASVSPSALNATHPSLALDGAGNPHLFFQGDDRQVYLQRQVNGTWASARPLSTSGSNSYPSARWSFYPLRSPAGPPTVDVVWTEATGTGNTVRFASLIGSAAAPTPAPGFVVSDAWFFGGLLAVLAGLVILGRLRRRKS